MIGSKILNIIKDLYLLNRSIITDDFDKALHYLKQFMDLEILEIPSGTECWTWVIPQKWNVREGFIKCGKKVILDLKAHPLHVAAYSQPFEGYVKKEELLKHLRWSKVHKDALVYEHIFAYHFQKNDWCLSLPMNIVDTLEDRDYYVKIDADFSNGALKVGEALLPGASEECVVIMGHLCHPGQADDGLSGVAVAAKLYEEIKKRKNRKFTYLFLVVPETIGSVAYLWKRPEIIPKLKHGIFLEMMGTSNSLALKHSLDSSNYIDKAAKGAMNALLPTYRESGFRELAQNDETVFADPDIDVPMISIQRFPYSEYHTSKDSPEILSEDKLTESFEVVKKIVDILEMDYVPERNFVGPAYLSRYNLYTDPRYNNDIHKSNWHVMQRLGSGQSILEIADELNLDFFELYDYVDKWKKPGLVL